MKYEIEIAEIAHADVEGIYSYVASDNPTAAEKIANAIYGTIEKLADNPTLGRRLTSRYDVKTEFRYTIAKKLYLVFYIAGETKVQIARVIDGRRDYLMVLGLEQR
jgi:plasmid stabilization system protein ParE